MNNKLIQFLKINLDQFKYKCLTFEKYNKKDNDLKKNIILFLWYDFFHNHLSSIFNKILAKMNWLGM